MQRIMKAQAYAKADDSSNSYYETQKKVLEVNPRHPLVKSLLARVVEEADLEDDAKDEHNSASKDIAITLVDTFRLRSGYSLPDSVGFSERVERMLRVSLGVASDATVEAEPEYAPDAEEEEDDEDDEVEFEGEEEEEEEGVEDAVVPTTEAPEEVEPVAEEAEPVAEEAKEEAKDEEVKDEL